ncbi:hypothetical protein ACTJJ0_24540 [Chitinophaga sp. 22321]|uniref:Uncharacterized protein n=1 Tax=Chitinophaga hostae TaxID=2831022 RepID=A0ABS5J646_9BACT|nr:hypothetical protein [Chitinophaga hostae]MBS0030695.1 hypothetical protein [Chitinophaga hostae]
MAKSKKKMNPGNVASAKERLPKKIVPKKTSFKKGSGLNLKDTVMINVEAWANPWSVDCETKGHRHLGNFPTEQTADGCKEKHEAAFPECIVHVTGPQ